MSIQSVDCSCSLSPFTREDCLSMQEVKQNVGWGITAFDLSKTWEITQGEGIVIAVLDTGCDLDHPDLVNNLLPGYNCIKPGTPPEDDNGHGTHIIGVLVAENNQIGMIGVCPKAKVMPIKTLDEEGNGNMLNVSNGIRWAVDNGADFISMSLGTPVPVAEVRKAIQYAHNKGVITFVAAGNSFITAGTCINTKDVFYPAAYPETIAIGAISKDFCRADFSNVGKNLDFMAPGVDIYSTVPGDWYAKMSGTSMAQPFACGIAALVKSFVVVQKRRPDIKLKTAFDYRNLLKENTIPVANCNYDNPKFYQGFGVIDPRKFFESKTLTLPIDIVNIGII